MAAVATTGGDPVRSGDIARELGYKNAANASKTRDTLIRKGLIYSPDHGLVAFTVPYFAAFMRRKHPLASGEG